MKNRNRFLLLIAFTSGMCVMAMEIAAARLIAPYFGTSIFVWTNVIGIVLVALSFGYYIGGKYADRRPELNAILYPMLVAGLIFLAVPWIVKPLASFVTYLIAGTSSATVIFTGSFIMTILLFAFPLMLLGMVSPFVIRLYKVDRDHVGEMAGSVFAVSTLGSILGTFLPTLFFIPTIGTRVTISIFAGALVLLATAGVARGRFKWAMVLVFLLPIIAWPPAQVSSAPDVIFEDESAYQYISVDHKDGRYLLRFNEGVGIQSVYDPDSDVTGMYYDQFAMLPELFQTPALDVAILGLAGGSMSRQMPDHARIDGVEIDGKVIETAKQYFDIERPNLTIHEEDARLFIAGKKDAYDLVIVDAYSQQLYIPWTMTTKEFWEDVEASLKEDGLVAINVNAAASDAPLLLAIQHTMASVFDAVYVGRANDYSWNYLIVAGNREIDGKELNLEKISLDQDAFVLTDDRAPVEFMTDRMIFDYLAGR